MYPRMRQTSERSTAPWYDRSSSLVDSETIVQTLLMTTEAQQHIHRRTENQRCRVVCAFVRSEIPQLRKRAERLADCCKWPLLFVKSDGSVGMSMQRCKDRLCPVCSHLRGRQLAARIKHHVRQMSACRFITLTVNNVGFSLDEMCDRLMTAFKELRRSRAWRARVESGIWTVEIKPGTREGCWNVHLHILCDGEYFPQDELSAAWLSATGDSKVCDIRKVHDTKDAANYITKYVAKPGDFEKFSDEEIVDYAAAVKGRRLFGTFGKIHANSEESPKEDNVTIDQGSIVSVHAVRQLDASGSEAARQAIDLLERCGGFYALAVGAPWKPSVPITLPEDRKKLASALVCCAAEISLLRSSAAAGGTPPLGNPPVAPQQLNIDDWLHSRLMC